MLISFFFLLLAYDSLPPVPDLSTSVFPEPCLWIKPKDNYLILDGYAGNFYGANFNLDYCHLNLSAHYEKKNEWDSTQTGAITTSYSIPLPHLWLKPAFFGYFLQRDDEYRVLTPSLFFSSTLPWSIISGELYYDLWQINRINYIEQEAKLDIIFDQTAYLPHFEIAEVYTGGQIKPKITVKSHIRNLHVAVGTPILHGFFSPCVEIKYLDPRVKIETKFKSGSLYRTVRQYANFEMPIKYRPPMLEESLKVGIDLNFTYDLYKHYFALSSFYKSWNVRLIPGNNFWLKKTHDVQEVNFAVLFKNDFSYKSININNILHVQYNWSDDMIPFLPKYALCDTLSINYGCIEMSSEIKYLSKRNGVLTKILSPTMLINPIFGLKFKILKVFLKVYNITDEKGTIFDGYVLTQRQFASGLEINYRF